MVCINTGAGSQQIQIRAAAGATLAISGSGSLTTTCANARAIVVGGSYGQSGAIMFADTFESFACRAEAG